MVSATVPALCSKIRVMSQTQPFAIGQEKAFQTGPFLGGYVFVLTAPVAAGGTVAITHPMRVPPRHVEVVSTPNGTYPSRVCFSAKTGSTATVQFESAQPIGTAVWMW